MKNQYDHIFSIGEPKGKILSSRSVSIVTVVDKFCLI